MNSGGTAGTSATPGGSLSITGGSITLNPSAVIEVASGQVQLTASSGDITLKTGAQIQAQGIAQQTAGTATTGVNSYSPGGEIYLSAASGNITLMSGSVLNVSAAAQGDAGAISLAAPTGTVTLAGTLNGNATAGAGGSFTLDANTFLDANNVPLTLNALNGMLQIGGFNNQLNIRARKGNLELDSGQYGTMTAEDIVLEADGYNGTGGNISINSGAIINALPDSSGNGGQVYLYAQNSLTVNGTINANAVSSQGTGGYVYLNSEGSNGFITQNGVINVNGGSSGTGGTVYLRAQQNTNGPNGAGVNIAMPGTINGASQVVAEAFVVEQENSTSGFTINSMNMNNTINAWLSAASTYITNIESSGNMPTGWNSQSSLYHFRPGIEIQNSLGDITLSTDLDLTSNLFGLPGSVGEPGVLTLRAAGNLNINANLVDAPTPYSSLYSSSNAAYNNMQNSWGFNLTAGADLAAANPLAVKTGLSTTMGNLTIAADTVVYTEDAPINFASANNTSISTGSAAGYMITGSVNSSDPITGAQILPIYYSLASYGGNIRGEVGGNLTFTNGGAIQTATGNISIAIGGNLDLYDSNNRVLGAIRTTGEYAQGTLVQEYPGGPFSTPAQINDYWTYENGGDIHLDVAGAVNGIVNTITDSTNGQTNAWDWVYGGGTPSKPKNMQLAASFQGVDATQGIATMGGGDIWVRTGGSFTCQIGDFGTYSSGNLDIDAGGDLTGRFRVMNGTANLISGGNFGAAATNGQQVIDLANAQFSVSAQGDAYLGAVLNPDITNQNIFKGKTIWNLTYDYAGDPNITDSYNTSVTISSLTGNLYYYGISNFAGYQSGIPQQILPPSVSLLAAGKIDLYNDIYLAPSPTGNIQLFAGGSIDGQVPGSNAYSQVYMYDQAHGGFLRKRTNYQW